MILLILLLSHISRAEISIPEPQENLTEMGRLIRPDMTWSEGEFFKHFAEMKTRFSHRYAYGFTAAVALQNEMEGFLAFPLRDHERYVALILGSQIAYWNAPHLYQAEPCYLNCARAAKTEAFATQSVKWAAEAVALAANPTDLDSGYWSFLLRSSRYHRPSANFDLHSLTRKLAAEARYYQLRAQYLLVDAEQDPIRAQNSSCALWQLALLADPEVDSAGRNRILGSLHTSGQQSLLRSCPLPSQLIHGEIAALPEDMEDYQLTEGDAYPAADLTDANLVLSKFRRAFEFDAHSEFHVAENTTLYIEASAALTGADLCALKKLFLDRIPPRNRLSNWNRARYRENHEALRGFRFQNPEPSPHWIFDNIPYFAQPTCP